MFRRNITLRLIEALSDTPVVFVGGARQVGKTTLVQSLAEGRHPARYLTLDDPTVLSAARSDAAGFLDALDGPVVLDEVQRAPELFLPIKASVDRERRSGRYLLTGSANITFLPDLTRALMGRMEILTLRPLSQGEIGGVEDGFIDAVFGRRLPEGPWGAEAGSGIRSRVLRGGYPEPIQRRSEDRRRAWVESYVAATVQRDVRDLANVERLAELPQVLSLLAARVGGLLNHSDVSRATGIPQTSLKRYLSLFQATALLEPLPAWSVNLGKRLIKSPKVMLSDTGLAAALQGIDAKRLGSEPELFGPLIENFVVCELRKQADWSRSRPRLYHLRPTSGRGVDIILEDRSGRVVGVEVKASATAGAGDFAGLRAVADALGERFVRGIVLHTGQEPVPFGRNLMALPVGSLWTTRAGLPVT